MNVDNFPRQQGSYALCFSLKQSTLLQVGKLGTYIFPQGMYIYLGSAQGNGGIRARLQHHFYYDKKPHWHIDWLRTAAAIIGGFYFVGSQRYECVWAKHLSVLSQSSIPVLGFGSSDCRHSCRSHLVLLGGDDPLDQVLKVVKSLHKGDKHLRSFIR